MTDCLALRLPEWRAVLLKQLHHRPLARLIHESHRDRRTVRRADIGDAPRLPVGLADHVADDGDFRDHAVVDAILVELRPLAVRAQQALRKQRGPAGPAAPDADTRGHTPRSRIAAAAVPP